MALKQALSPQLVAACKEPMEGAEAPSKSSKQWEEKTAPFQEPGTGSRPWGEVVGWGLQIPGSVFSLGEWYPSIHVAIPVQTTAQDPEKEWAERRVKWERLTILA